MLIDKCIKQGAMKCTYTVPQHTILNHGEDQQILNQYKYELWSTWQLIDNDNSNIN